MKSEAPVQGRFANVNISQRFQQQQQQQQPQRPQSIPLQINRGRFQVFKAPSKPGAPEKKELTRQTIGSAQSAPSGEVKLFPGGPNAWSSCKTSSPEEMGEQAAKDQGRWGDEAGEMDFNVPLPGMEHGDDDTQQHDDDHQGRGGGDDGERFAEPPANTYLPPHLRKQHAQRPPPEPGQPSAAAPYFAATPPL
eukprot:RCo015267